MITINYDDRACGTGKTYQAIKTICEMGGRHLYVVDRREAIEDRAATFRALSDQRSFVIQTISSKSARHYGQRSVRLQVEAIPEEVAAHADVIVIITHEAMKIADFSAFDGQDWSIWIDEVPSILDNDRHQFELSWETLAAYYDLEEIEQGWSRVRMRDDAPELALLSRDHALGVLRPFHRRVADPRREVFANLTDWSELGQKGRDLGWYSLWSPLELWPFRAIFMLGNSLTHSATFRIWCEQWPEVQWQAMSATSPPFALRHAIITYYAEAHQASRALFNSPNGQQNLGKIVKHLALRTPSGRHIWSCNPVDEPAFRRLPGIHLKPMQAGSNDYAYADHVTMMYSAKPSPLTRGIYRRIGVDPAWHAISAEFETILQFVCRTSVRSADDNRDIHIQVYDRQQAEYLRDYFQNDPRRYVLPELRLENLGFAYDRRDSRPGRKPVVLTLEEREAKKVADRLKDRDRKRRQRTTRRCLKVTDDREWGRHNPLFSQPK